MADPTSPPGLFADYAPPAATWDEYVSEAGEPHTGLESIFETVRNTSAEELRHKSRLAEATFHRGGVTFSVYSDDRGVEKVFPFDLVPRPVDAKAWEQVEKGLVQRVAALEAFLADVYHEGHAMRDGVIPREIVEGSAGYLEAAKGVRPPGGVYAHISGIDLIRDADGTFRVLEDNIRCPSGVSYVLENRAVMKRVYPNVFTRSRIEAVDQYPFRLRDAFASLSAKERDPSMAILTPGSYNSAYFEHSYLARRMGIPLAEASDLYVENDRLYLRTTQGPRRVHVLYRRVDDAFIDPKVFRSDSLLGVPGLYDAYRAGKLVLANAIGNGIADDKAVYPFVPDLIRYYLKQEPILPQVHTYVCLRDDDREYVIEHLDELVVKAVDESGGYGMLMGPQASKAERDAFAKAIEADPRRYIAQPLIELSTCPVWDGEKLVPRRVDLRPFIIQGTSIWVLPGGLTRVALREGSYVVNSSQGGGSKDTWILRGGR